jgi:hypothetical protein
LLSEAFAPRGGVGIWDYIDIQVLLDEMFELGTIDDRDPFALGELLGGSAEPRCGNQHALVALLSAITPPRACLRRSFMFGVAA